MWLCFARLTKLLCRVTHGLKVNLAKWFCSLFGCFCRNKQTTTERAESLFRRINATRTTCTLVETHYFCSRARAHQLALEESYFNDVRPVVVDNQQQVSLLPNGFKPRVHSVSPCMVQTKVQPGQDRSVLFVHRCFCQLAVQCSVSWVQNRNLNVTSRTNHALATFDSLASQTFGLFLRAHPSHPSHKHRKWLTNIGSSSTWWPSTKHQKQKQTRHALCCRTFCNIEKHQPTSGSLFNTSCKPIFLGVFLHSNWGCIGRRWLLLNTREDEAPLSCIPCAPCLSIGLISNKLELPRPQSGANTNFVKAWTKTVLRHPSKCVGNKGTRREELGADTQPKREPPFIVLVTFTFGPEEDVPHSFFCSQTIADSDDAAFHKILARRHHHVLIVGAKKCGTSESWFYFVFLASVSKWCTEKETCGLFAFHLLCYAPSVPELFVCKNAKKKTMNIETCSLTIHAKLIWLIRCSKPQRHFCCL